MLSTRERTESSESLGSTGLLCDVAAHARVRADAAALAAWRRDPGQLGETRFPPAMLKHADEQTVVAVVAVLRAVAEHGLGPASFGDWGVMVAGRFPGQQAFERAWPKFSAEGAWGVSPHLIPHSSLHSASGLLSQVLQAHGPNLGVGGAPGGEIEALLSSAIALHEGDAPGVWAALTGREPDGTFEALALALVPPRDDPCRYPLRLRLSPDRIAVVGARVERAFDLPALRAGFAGPRRMER